MTGSKGCLSSPATMPPAAPGVTGLFLSSRKVGETLVPLKGRLKHAQFLGERRPKGASLERRQGSSWVESEQMLRARMCSSVGERACAGAREKSALPVLEIARFVRAAGESAAGGERWTPDETPSPP